MKTQTNTPNMETEVFPDSCATHLRQLSHRSSTFVYNIVDRICYIGHIPGDGAADLTGVGLWPRILMLLNAFAMLVGFRRCPACAAIAMGKKDNELAEKTRETVLLC